MDLTLDQVLQKGIEAYKAGKIQEAEKFYTGILQSHPKHPGANHNMGVLAFGIGKAQEALLFFQTAVKEEPSIVQFRISHIEALMKLDKFSDARAAINQAHDKGIKGDAFDQLEQRINELDGNDTDVEDSRTSEKRSNILDTLTLDQAVKLARKKLKGGLSEEAKSLYEDILVRFPKNKKATDGVKVISSGLSGTASNNQNPSSQKLQPLINLYNKGHHQQTLNQVAEMLKQFPRSLALHNICGAAHAGMGNFDAVIDSCKQAIKINPDYVDAYYNMGNALQDKGELDAAIASYKQAIKINPDYVEAYYNMGNVLKNMGDLDAAVANYKKAVKINPDYADAYSNMGSALQDKGELDAAIESYKQVIKINPGYVDAYSKMGNALQDKGELDAAIESYKQAIKINPDYIEAHNNLGVMLQELGRSDEAETSYKKAIKINPYFVEAYNNMSIALRDKGELKAAIESCKQAIKIDPGYAEAYSNMGNALQDEGELDTAIENYKQAIKINPSFAEAYNSMGNAFKDRGELDAAIESCKQAIKINPDYAEAYRNMGITLNDKGELEAAIESYKQAIKINPDYAEAYSNMGSALKDMGDLDAAIASYKKAVKINPHYAVPHSALGSIMYERGDVDSASYYFKKAFNFDPDLRINELRLIVLKARAAQRQTLGNSDTLSKVDNDSRLDTNPLILSRAVEIDLIDKLCEMTSRTLDNTKEARYGNGSCSINFRLFEDESSIIKTVSSDLTRIMGDAVKSKVYVYDSFFNILGAGGGSHPHTHISTHDNAMNLWKQKYSLVYYLSVGDQNCSDPGILKLYDPSEDILPSEGMITIIPASRTHSAVYSGKTDRVMIGVNFYSL